MWVDKETGSIHKVVGNQTAAARKIYAPECLTALAEVLPDKNTANTEQKSDMRSRAQWSEKNPVPRNLQHLSCRTE